MQQVAITTPTSPGSPVTVTQMPAGVPTTRAELEALRMKRGELSNQLVSAQNRRKTLADQLITADPSARPGIQARLKVLDDRLVRLESQIDQTGDLMANVPPVVLAETHVPQRIVNTLGREIVPITAIVSIFVLAPLALAFSWTLLKRGSAARVAAPDPATQQRLDHLQQAVDAIAIEVERISEGQRYVTKILSDRALGAGDPLRLTHKATSEVE